METVVKKIEQGLVGEEKARLLLKSLNHQFIQSPDWLSYDGKDWICVEVKHKERFLAPPFDGHGLNLSQVFLRKKLFEDTKIRTLLVIYEPSSDNILWQWLDILEAGKKFTTRNKVRIYPIEAFEKNNETTRGNQNGI